jgi:hypothetical protein
MREIRKEEKAIAQRTFPHKDDARPEARVARREADVDTLGACLLETGAGRSEMLAKPPPCAREAVQIMKTAQRQRENG